MRAPFYPFKLADLDDKGSCLIPLCASEYTETDNPSTEHAAGKATCKKVWVLSNVALSKSTKKKRGAEKRRHPSMLRADGFLHPPGIRGLEAVSQNPHAPLRLCALELPRWGQ